jgi:peptidoglycan/xylan/chitin deacetylase (PgdA/CDA1 family)
MTARHTLKRAISSVAPRAAHGGTRVLLYHAVDQPDPSDPLALRVSPQRFVEQMTLLRDGGYAVVPLAAALDPPPDDRVRVVITFDDGYRSQRFAADVLRQLGFPATFFVVPRFLDGVTAPSAYWESWGHLGWDEAAAMLDEGFELGAHSRTHRDLTACDDEALQSEVVGSKSRLEERLHRPIASFSYPHGRQNGRVRRAVADAGFVRACGSRFGVNAAAGGSRHSIRRTEITGADTLRDFRWKLLGKHDWFGYWQDARESLGE